MNSTLETALCLTQKSDGYIEGFALRGAIPAAYAMADAAAVTSPARQLRWASGAAKKLSIQWRTVAAFDSLLAFSREETSWLRWW
jgi:hypothetical protein